MPRGPRGEKRPGNPIACAVMVGKIATGEIEEKLPDPRRNGGKVGGPARAKILTAKRRSEIARKAAKARWESTT